MNPEDKKIIEKLESAAQGVKPNIMFEHELEKKLTAMHKPKPNPFEVLRLNIFPTLGWAAALVVLALGLNWAVGSLLAGRPAAGGEFICPVTEPNGSLPPGETVPSPEYLGNGQLWTVLWPGGRVIMEPHNLEPDHSLSMKWGWVRAVTGPLTIEGRRLDEESQPLRADIPDGYGDTGFQVSALIFPAAGCWEVTGRAGDASLTFVTEVIFDGATPEPDQIQAVESPIPATPISTDGVFSWRGTELKLAQTLPETPAEAHIFVQKTRQPATMEDARKLAQQFGMNGEVAETPGEIPGNFDYLILDGTQRLTVRSDHLYTYYSDFENFSIGTPPAEQAEQSIAAFLKQHRFEFQYHLEKAPQMSGWQYYVLPLTVDGLELRSEYMTPIRFNVTLDSAGKNIIFSGALPDYESIGKFGIITAQEAFQKILDPNPQVGIMESFRGNNGGGGGGNGFYQLNLSGTPMPIPTPLPAPSSNGGGGGGQVTQLITEGDTLEKITEHNGVSIDALMQANGLTDTRIFIGQTLIIPIEISPEKAEGLRGVISVVLYNQSDGSQRVEFGFSDPAHSYMLLEGDNLQGLENYQNRPVDLWGTITPNPDGVLTVTVDRYEIPFPDLTFEILKGRQESVEIDGQQVLLFTEDNGTQYVELLPNCYDIASPESIAGNGESGSPILVEALVIPDLSYDGHPAICVSSTAMAIDPASGQPVELLVTANQPYLMDEPSAAQTFEAPTALVEKIELSYYVANPNYSIPAAKDQPNYIQPIWRFYGHYSNGDEFEILVQALKNEFLSPEIQFIQGPG